MSIQDIVGWVVGGGLVTVLSGATLLWNNITNTKAMKAEVTELRNEVKILREENQTLRNKIAELMEITKGFSNSEYLKASLRHEAPHDCYEHRTYDASSMLWRCNKCKKVVHNGDK